jgi:hypothetical protein
MREIRLSGSEGGAVYPVPTPIIRRQNHWQDAGVTRELHRVAAASDGRRSCSARRDRGRGTVDGVHRQ